MRKNVVFMLFFCAAHAAMPLMCAHADTVLLATDEWCPYSCTPESESPGMLIETAARALGRFGHNVEYRLQGWSDAVASARRGEVAGLGGCSKEEAEGFVFPKVPLGSAQVVVFAPMDSTWIYKSPESLRGKRLGVAAGYDYGPEAAVFLADPAKYGISLKVVSEALPLKANLARIAAGEIDCLLGTRDVIRYVARIQGMETAVREAGVLGRPIPLYIPFSPALPESQKLADQLDAGVREMKKNGELAEILWKYGVLN